MFLLVGCAAVERHAFILNGLEPAVFESQNRKTGPLKFDGSFDITPEGVILLQTQGNIFDLGGETFLLKEAWLGLETFGASEGGLIRTISNQRLGVYQDARILELLPLPTPGMRIAIGSAGIYLYGGDFPPNNTLYFYEGSFTMIKLLETPRPISALTTAGQRIFFAMGQGIYTVRPGQAIRLLFLMPNLSLIESIAVDPEGEVIYFSSGGSVYALKEGVADLIAQKVGTTLKVHRGALYIWSPGDGQLLKLSGIENVLKTSKNMIN